MLLLPPPLPPLLPPLLCEDAKQRQRQREASCTQASYGDLYVQDICWHIRPPKQVVSIGLSRQKRGTCTWPFFCIMPTLPVSSGSSAGLAFNKANQAFHQHASIVASSLQSHSSAESEHVSMATMFLVAFSCVAAVGLLVYLIRCLMGMCSDDTFQKSLDADRCFHLRTFVCPSALIRLIAGMRITHATVPPARVTASFVILTCSDS